MKSLPYSRYGNAGVYPLLVLLGILLTGCVTSDTRPIEERMARQVVFTVSNELAADPSVLTSYSHASFTDIEPALVREKSQSIIDGVLRFHHLRKVSQWSVKSLGLETVVAEFGSKKVLSKVIAELEADDRVDTVESVKSYQLLTYNDPYFQLQNSVQSDDIEQIHRLATGKDVIIGVVDTGMDRNHPELMDRIIYSKNFVSHDQTRFDQDEHGTSVAGVIGSAANNELGIVGVAPDVKLMAFKACWQDRITRRAKCDSLSLLKALVDVIDQQPDIINLSLSGPEDQLIRKLLKAASDRGIVIVAAVAPGNATSFPAVMKEVIAVGTSLGRANSGNGLSIIAPGTDVLTTTPGATYAFRSGSSMSTAYITGIAALMKERQPTLSGEQIRVHLRSTATNNIGTVPVVDMCAAVSKAGESCQPHTIVMVDP